MSNKDSRQPVLVTRASLPPFGRYMECIRDIFESRWLTNQGVYVSRLEKGLAEFFGTPFLSICANGTLALQLALRLMDLGGKKVITTPFTYVATLSALLWEGCTPLFADIDPDSLCIDPAQVERLLHENPDVAGILPVHVYGNACDVHALAKLGEAHDVRIIYDAAHAFGSQLNGKSLLAYGDSSICSFHATKLFHTVEGGCIVAKDARDHEKIRLMRAFGHVSDDYECLGINAKISELHAAMGVCLLEEATTILERRARLSAIYDAYLDMDGTSGIKRPGLAQGLKWNHAYYPVIFPDHASMLRTMENLKQKDIHPRRYFYPSLTKLPYVQSPSCAVSEDMADRVLCLPFWADMEESLIKEISATVLASL